MALTNGAVIIGVMSALVALGALVERKFVRATIFGLVYPTLLFVWPPRSLLIELMVVAGLIGADWILGAVSRPASQRIG